MTLTDSICEIKTNISTKRDRKEGRKAYVNSFISRKEQILIKPCISIDINQSALFSAYRG